MGSSRAEVANRQVEAHATSASKRYKSFPGDEGNPCLYVFEVKGCVSVRIVHAPQSS
jgi:hypothetical protein